MEDLLVVVEARPSSSYTCICGVSHLSIRERGVGFDQNIQIWLLCASATFSVGEDGVYGVGPWENSEFINVGDGG